jgi:hypothetical protein
MGNVSNRGRYEKLTDPHLALINMLIDYTRLITTEFSALLESNKNATKDFLMQNNWSKADLDKEWVIKNGVHLYGSISIANGYLENTKGIRFSSKQAKVSIGNFGEEGGLERPYISCSKTKF